MHAVTLVGLGFTCTRLGYVCLCAVEMAHLLRGPRTNSAEHKPKTPPPDLPSLLLDSRIVYLGMPVRISFTWGIRCDALPHVAEPL